VASFQARRLALVLAIAGVYFAILAAGALARGSAHHSRHHKHRSAQHSRHHKRVHHLRPGCGARARHTHRRHRASCAGKVGRRDRALTPANTSPPSIAGSAVEGQTLSASVGSWSGSTPMHYTYQWQREGRNVSGSTGASYLLTSADVGHRMDVVVTATNSAGSSLTTSASTAAVSPATSSGGEAPPPPPPVPTVTGVSPASGPEAGGTSVTITGSNFTGATKVTFGSASTVGFTVSSGSSITAISPAGAGTVDVTVASTAGTSATGSADRFAYEKGVLGATRYRGVNSHAPWYWKVSDLEVKREIAEAAVLGVNVIRIPVEWGAIEAGGEGVRGGKALARLDLIVSEAAAYGIKIDGTIAGTPSWASPGKQWMDAPLEPEKSLRGFAKFLTARYGTELLAVGVLNEPDKGENLKTPTNEPISNTTVEGVKRRAYYYVKDVKAVFAGAKEGNAAVKVLAHEDGAEVHQSVAPFIFLKDCFAEGMKGYYDAISGHFYSEGAAPESTYENSIKAKIERMHGFLVEQEGPETVPIWNSEWGYSIEDSEAVRADYVEKGVRMLDAQFPYLEGWTYFQLRDTSNEPLNPEDNFGLLHYSFEPRLSFAAFIAGMT
jgi:hypothetical protein